MNAPTCTLLPWDTAFFGFPIARLHAERLTSEVAERALRWCDEKQVRCLSFLCPPDDDESAAVAREHHFQLVDVRVEFSWRITDVADRSAGPPEAARVIRPFRDADLPALLRLCVGCFGLTRFSRDRNFPPGSADRMYQQWLVNSCRNTPESVLVAEDGGGVAGFLTCQLESQNRGRIGLVAVSGDRRGEGIGRSLVAGARASLVEQGVEEIRVATQDGNAGAVRLYLAQGFRRENSRPWYHRWFARPPVAEAAP